MKMVMEKNVLVVDDILSSGTTMAEMIRQLEELEPSKIVGLTLFKHTTVSKIG
jgi:hypoxanthine phosphoribosyltransferase